MDAGRGGGGGKAGGEGKHIKNEPTTLHLYESLSVAVFNRDKRRNYEQLDR